MKPKKLKNPHQCNRSTCRKALNPSIITSITTVRMKKQKNDIKIWRGASVPEV
uniref:Candidate secreted effector n=1 Tax=Meloidogyne incognita TaxID=6306 RepID=A0A914KJQ7_MELIC